MKRNPYLILPALMLITASLFGLLATGTFEKLLPDSDEEISLSDPGFFQKSIESPFPGLLTAPSASKAESGVKINMLGKTELSGKVEITNSSSYAVNINDYIERTLRLGFSGSGPQVLIYHTHGSEAYTQSGANTYEASDSFRTLDKNQNLIRIGSEVASVLNSAGVNTIHSTTLHDSPSYSGAYSRSLAETEDILSKYPSIKVMLDLHRDADSSSDGLRVCTEIGGKTAAQLEIIVGTDGGGLYHPNWQKNLLFAVKLHQLLESLYPGLMRPISLRDSRYNQQLTEGSILIEMGGNGNTIEEALISARILAEALVILLD